MIIIISYRSGMKYMTQRLRLFTGKKRGKDLKLGGEISPCIKIYIGWSRGLVKYQHQLQQLLLFYE
jgi:hypothetical protein